MIKVFLATLNPMLTLFLFMILGFTLYKIKILPEDSAKVMAKLETYLFVPALSIASMLTVTPDKIATHATNIIFSGLSVGLAICLALLIAPLFVKDKQSYERKVYNYALTFANSGYLGDPVVLALFGLEGLAYYKIACIPVSIMCYGWGVPQLVPKGQSGQGWKRFFPLPSICTYVGLLLGLTGVGTFINTTPALKFATDGLEKLGDCMGPVAMLIAGITVARFPFKPMLTNKKVYFASFLRLIVLPAIILCVLFGVKELANLVFGLHIDNLPLFLIFFMIATPLGLNTVVFPEAYGGDPSIGASMTMISHTLCIITIPLIFALLCTLLGAPPVF